MSTRQHPKFSWSWSRDGMLSRCAHLYLHHYYTAHYGRRRNASHQERLAFRARQLTSLHLVLGKILHTQAQRCADLALEGEPIPGAEMVAEEVRIELRDVCRRARDDFGKFLLDPGQGEMIASLYYTGRWDPREVAAVTEKINPCAAHLVDSPLWEEIRGLDSRSVLRFPKARKLWHDEIGTVYSAPDLVILRDDEGTVEIVDFKTGQTGDVRDQIGIYAWFVPQLLEIPFHDRIWTGRVIGLHDGTDEVHAITRATLSRAEAQIRQSVEWMVELMEDPTVNEPKALDDVPLPRPDIRERICPYCPMRQVCTGVLQRHGGQGIANPLWRLVRWDGSAAG